MKFIDHNEMCIRCVKLVYPHEANGVDLVSVTDGLASALIGLGPGQTITWYEDRIERRIAVLETSQSR